MSRNMYQWIDEMIAAEKKKALPVLSFPSVQKMGVTVDELIRSSDLMSRGVKLVADSFDTAAAVSYMDLSVEAEAFGSEIRFSDDEVPTVIGLLKASPVRPSYRVVLPMSLSWGTKSWRMCSP